MRRKRHCGHEVLISFGFLLRMVLIEREFSLPQRQPIPWKICNLIISFGKTSRDNISDVDFIEKYSSLSYAFSWPDLIFRRAVVRFFNEIYCFCYHLCNRIRTVSPNREPIETTRAVANRLCATSTMIVLMAASSKFRLKTI